MKEIIMSECDSSEAPSRTLISRTWGDLDVLIFSASTYTKTFFIFRTRIAPNRHVYESATTIEGYLREPSSLWSWEGTGVIISSRAEEY